MLFVDFSWQAQRYRSGYCAAFLCDSAEDRTLSSTSPSCRQFFLKGKTKFIPKHDFCAEPLWLFLSLAHLVATMPSLVLCLVQLLDAKAFVGWNPSSVTSDWGSWHGSWFQISSGSIAALVPMSSDLLENHLPMRHDPTCISAFSFAMGSVLIDCLLLSFFGDLVCLSLLSPLPNRLLLYD